MKLQVIDVMIQCLSGSLDGKLENWRSRSKSYKLTAISSSSFHSKNVVYANS
jgi:hypothetical protein